MKDLLESQFLQTVHSNHDKVFACNAFLEYLRIITELDLYPDVPVEEHLISKAKSYNRFMLMLDLEKPEEVAEVKNLIYKNASKLPSVPSPKKYHDDLHSLVSKINTWKNGEPATVTQDDMEFNELSNKRTKTMVDRMDNLLRQDRLNETSNCISKIFRCIQSIFSLQKNEVKEERQRYFFAIGTQHCWGSNGAKRLLENKGWILKRISHGSY
jgi:hypothetical protein